MAAAVVSDDLRSAVRCHCSRAT